MRPEIKYAGEQVLRNIGLTMTQAMELFLRRTILDQRLPFEVVALNDELLTEMIAAWEAKKTTSQSIELIAKKVTRKRQERE